MGNRKAPTPAPATSKPPAPPAPPRRLAPAEIPDRPIDEAFVRRAVDLLNEALALDPEAISSMVSKRVPCNQALAFHPTIQTGIDGSPHKYHVGLLGILNGIAGATHRSGWGAIAAIVESSGEVTRFEVLEGRLVEDNSLDDTQPLPAETLDERWPR